MPISSSLTNITVEDYLISNYNLSELADVDDGATPLLGYTIIGNGSAWVAQPSTSNIEIELSGVSIGTQPIINFIPGVSGIVTAVNDGGNNRVNVTITGLNPANDLSDVNDTQISLNNLINTTNNNTFSTNGNVQVGGLAFIGSYRLAVNEAVVSSSPYTLTWNTTADTSKFLQSLEPDTVDVDVELPVSPDIGATFLIIHAGAVNNLLVKDGAATISTLAGGGQAQAVYLTGGWTLI